MARDLQVSQPLEAREDWIEDELASCEFADVRHGKRLGKLLVTCPRKSLPFEAGVLEFSRKLLERTEADEEEPF